MKVVLSIVGIALIALIWAFSSFLNPLTPADNEGDVVIRVIDKNGQILIEDTHTFSEEDTLKGILDEHYQTLWLSTFHGEMLLGIGTVLTDSHRDYIEIRIDGKLYIRGITKLYKDERAPYGVSNLPLIDGNVYIFRYQTVEGTGGD